MDYNRLGLSFDAKKQIHRKNFDTSTFDLVDKKLFYNTNFSTVAWYLVQIVLVFLSIAQLASDVYTCLNILVFKHWSSAEYQPYAYTYAKWIFTGCIIFQFVLLLYHWIWAIRAYRLRNIALVYVNPIAKTLYTFRSYSYHCLFGKIEHDNFFDWSAFLTYGELDNALQVLIADAPRQVINVLTLRYYATDAEHLNDILKNIADIANTNIRLSVILLIMCLSVLIFSIFFFKFCLGILFYFPVIVGIKKRGYSSLKKYCCDVINTKVRVLVRKYHLSTQELVDRGIMSKMEIASNPLLSASRTHTSESFGMSDFKRDQRLNYSQTNLNHSLSDLTQMLAYKPEGYENSRGGSVGLSRPVPSHQSTVHGSNPFRDASASALMVHPQWNKLPRSNTQPAMPATAAGAVRKAPTDPVGSFANPFADRPPPRSFTSQKDNQWTTHMNSTDSLGSQVSAHSNGTSQPSRSNTPLHLQNLQNIQNQPNEHIPADFPQSLDGNQRCDSQTQPGSHPNTPVVSQLPEHGFQLPQYEQYQHQHQQHQYTPTHDRNPQQFPDAFQPSTLVQPFGYPVLAVGLDMQFPILSQASTQSNTIILKQLYIPYQPQYHESDFETFHLREHASGQDEITENAITAYEPLILDEYSVDDEDAKEEAKENANKFSNRDSSLPSMALPLPYPARGSSILDDFDYSQQGCVKRDSHTQR